MRKTLLAGAVAAVALLFAGVVPRPAEALPVSEQHVTHQGGVTLIKRGGGHGHGGGMRSFRGGGGPRFHGPKMGGGGRPHFRGGHHGGHRHRGRGIRIYPRYYGYVPYFYDGYYFDDYAEDDCEWLRRKALRTNSKYWWRRYRACRASY